jgi:hypothetical protein
MVRWGLVPFLLAIGLMPGSPETTPRPSWKTADSSATAAIHLSASQKEDANLRLINLLGKTALYCHRLENAALDFVCLEEITEDIDYSREKSGDFASKDTIVEKNTYLYDYQFIRKENIKKEVRKPLMIMKDGRLATVKEPGLLTSAVRVEYVLFGPIGLLGENWRPRRNFRIAGEDAVIGERAVILESRIRPGMEGSHCDGNAWIRESDGSVLKIEWDQSTLGGFKQIEERARSFKAEPRMTSTTEYGFEKNGLRFPSLDITEEAYLKAGKEPFIRARTVIRYKNYRFFTVESKAEVSIK